jgi:hypothetical protein
MIVTPPRDAGTGGQPSWFVGTLFFGRERESAAEFKYIANQLINDIDTHAFSRRDRAGGACFGFLEAARAADALI